MHPQVKSLIVSLVVPVVALVAGVLVLGPATWTVAGIPPVFVLMFALFPITTALMWFSWWRWDATSSLALDEVRPVVTTPVAQTPGDPAQDGGTR